MAVIGAPTPTLIQAQIAAINNNNFLTQAQKSTQINALNAQLQQAIQSGYSGNVSGQDNSSLVSKVFNTQQALTQALGARAAQVTSTPEFVNAKSLGATKPALDQMLTQQGVYVSTPELQAFNNLIQNVPLQPSEQANVNNLLSRINSPVITSGSTNADVLYNYLVRHGSIQAAQQSSGTPNTLQSTPAAGGGYQPPSNLPQVNVPPNFPNLPQIPTPPPLNVPNLPQLPLTPPAGGGTSSGGADGGSGGSATVPNPLPSIGGFDIMGFITSLLSNPIALIAIVVILGALFYVAVVPRKGKLLNKVAMK